MSLATWKAEFYPIPADAVPKDQAIAHSLQKWQGMTAANLAIHGVSVTDSGDLEDDDQFLEISTRTCALCEHYYVYDCHECPLTAVRGEPCHSGDHAPFDAWMDGGDPLPMIALIESAAKREERQRTEEVK